MGHTAAVRFAWPASDQKFFLALVDAASGSQGFRGTSKSELYVAFHKPAINFYQRAYGMRPGASAKLIVTYTAGSKPDVTIKWDAPAVTKEVSKAEENLPYDEPLATVGRTLISMLERNSKDGTSSAQIDFVVTKTGVDLRLFQALSDGRTKERSDAIPARVAVISWLAKVVVAQNSNVTSLFTATFSVKNGGWNLDSWKRLGRVEQIVQRDTPDLYANANLSGEEDEFIVDDVKATRRLYLDPAAMIFAELSPARLDNLVMMVAPFAVVKIGKLAKLRNLTKAAILKMIIRPKAVQWVRGSRRLHVDIKIDPKVLDRALELRKSTYGVTYKAFKRNVTVWDVTIDGKRQFLHAGNIPTKKLNKKIPKSDPDLADVGFHSEPLVMKQITQLRREGREVKVNAIYTERRCCSNCASTLNFDETLNNTPIYHSVDEYDGTKVQTLMDRYGIKVD